MFVRKAERLLCQLVLTIERGFKNGRVVGIDRDHQSMIEVRTNRMIAGQAAAAGTKVAGDTDFDGNLALGKFLDQFGVLNGRQNVAKTLGTKVERAPDRFRARSFSG